MKLRLGIIPKLTLLFVLFAAVLVISLSVLVYENARAALQTAAVSGLLSTALEKQTALNAWVDERQQDVAALAATPNMTDKMASLMTAKPGSMEARRARNQLVSDFAPYVKPQGVFLEIMALDPETGEVLASTKSAEEGKFKESLPFFINGRNSAYVQNVYYSVTLQAPAMTASAPVYSKDGRLQAVLAARLNLEEMNVIIVRRTGLHQSDEAFLVNTSNLFITQPRLIADPAVLQRGVHTEAVKHCLERSSGVISALDYRGVPALIVYKWLPERQLCLIVKIDQAEALAQANVLGGTILAVSGLILMIASALAYWLARGITRPIRALQEGAERLGQGELDMRLDVTSQDELGRLSQTFNEMADTLAKRANQLETANKELQAFAYSVSHDLRAPLRGIDGFSQALMNKYSGQLGEEGEHYLTRVRANAQRMGQLIDDLLTLSRVSRQEMSHQPVDLSTLGNDIAAMLGESDPRRKVRFQIAEQAIVEGDAGLLKVVMQNLLENAWKFTSLREMAEIEVGFSENEKRVFYVRDNGVGFDMQYADKLFGAFQRLHSTKEFPGTGIGLATVQRVIHRHGGRIWAEASLDQGATFYFTLGENS